MARRWPGDGPVMGRRWVFRAKSEAWSKVGIPTSVGRIPTSVVVCLRGKIDKPWVTSGQLAKITIVGVTRTSKNACVGHTHR